MSNDMNGSSQNSEALPIVAWRYIEERFGKNFWRLTDSGGEEMGASQALTPHAKATATIQALQEEVRAAKTALEMAVRHIETQHQIDQNNSYTPRELWPAMYAAIDQARKEQQ